MVDLSGCSSRDEALELLAGRAGMLAGDQWVLAHGARPEGWEDARWMTRGELDEACGGRAVCVWCFDYHALVGSSRALELAGIDGGTRFEHGRVEVDGDGTPTGLLLEHAALALWGAVPEPSEKERHGVVREACAHLKALGYSEVHDLKAQDWLGVVLNDLLAAGEVDQRFGLWALRGDLDALMATRDAWDARVALGGMKIFVDGTLNSRTAWVLERWADAPEDRPFGTAMMSHDEIEDSICFAEERGVPIAAHAIGDGAVRAVLDGIEKTKTQHTGHRIEHAELIDRADVARFAGMGVVCSVQPCHLLADIEALRRGCPDRLDRVLPLRELIDAGLVCGESLIFGSDVPIVRADHRDSVIAATLRRREVMGEAEAIGIDQRLTEGEAMACFGG